MHANYSFEGCFHLFQPSLVNTYLSRPELCPTKENVTSLDNATLQFGPSTSGLVLPSSISVSCYQSCSSTVSYCITKPASDSNNNAAFSVAYTGACPRHLVDASLLDSGIDPSVPRSSDRKAPEKSKEQEDQISSPLSSWSRKQKQHNHDRGRHRLQHVSTTPEHPSIMARYHGTPLPPGMPSTVERFDEASGSTTTDFQPEVLTRQEILLSSRSQSGLVDFAGAYRQTDSSDLPIAHEAGFPPEASLQSRHPQLGVVSSLPTVVAQSKSTPRSPSQRPPPLPPRLRTARCLEAGYFVPYRLVDETMGRTEQATRIPDPLASWLANRDGLQSSRDSRATDSGLSAIVTRALVILLIGEELDFPLLHGLISIPNGNLTRAVQSIVSSSSPPGGADEAKAKSKPPFSSAWKRIHFEKSGYAKFN
ncbi:unnamed protein product [Protopolystoma xenopodis]|uniref:Uncharacterized protein n=1 Tax=Protopolystoma xenopodis TaxID=117903 RepID=A0A448XJG5_9PLAT|nr:unnamed protein product [Protopolystoma xenopodis]